MNGARELFAAYLCQQKELGMPDFVLSEPFAQFGIFTMSKTPAVHNLPAVAQTVRPAVSVALKKGPGLVSIDRLHGSSLKTPSESSGIDPVRDALIKLYNNSKDCRACGLGALRKNFVFGSGNAHAGLMVVGEAPGADEDEQGVPFVGKAGELLTKMLSAIGLDRKKHVFIANVLKCRPPENRTPEQTEIAACGKILTSQIDIIKPKAILLLGRIAAHTLLDTKASIAQLRTETHAIGSIPAFVTYHPASLLRNEEYKRPAWEDMQKLQRALTEAGVYADSSI